MGFWDTLGYVGDTLDKATGARAARGLLAGRPRELLSVVPFSDRLGITDERDITTGRSLTDRIGLTTPGASDWGSAGAGFLAEAVLDPSNLIGAGALRKLSKLDLGHLNPFQDVSGRIPSRVADTDYHLGLKYDTRFSPTHPGYFDEGSGRMVPPKTDSSHTIVRPDMVGAHRYDARWLNNRTHFHEDTGNLESLLAGTPEDRIRALAFSDDAGSWRPIDGGLDDATTTRQSQLNIREGGVWNQTHSADRNGIADVIRRIVEPFRDENRDLWANVNRGGQDVATAFLLPQLARLPRPAFDDALNEMVSRGVDALPTWDVPGWTMSFGDRGGRPVDSLFLLDPTNRFGVHNPIARTSPLSHAVRSRSGRMLLPDGAHELGLVDDGEFSFGQGLKPTHPYTSTRNQMFDPFPGESPALNRAAMAVGPGYDPDPDKVRELIRQVGGGRHEPRLDALNDTLLRRLSAEIPDSGMSPLQSGLESAVFAGPENSVIRLGFPAVAERFNTLPEGRPNLPEYLQPVRSVDIGPYQVEHLNRVTPLNAVGGELAALPSIHAVLAKFRQIMRAKGMHPWDDVDRNLGVTPQGRGIGIDPNMAVPVQLGERDPRHIYHPQGLQYPPPEQVAELLRMGAPSAVRDAMSRGFETNAAGQGFDVEDHGNRILRILSGEPVDPDPMPMPNDLFGNMLRAFGSDFSMGQAMAPAMPGAGAIGGGTTLQDLLRNTSLLRNVDPRLVPGLPKGATGYYKPSTDTAIQLANSPNPGVTRRHELLHAAAANAAKQGQRTSLPYAMWPSAGAKYAGATNLGRYLEEAAVTGLQNRGLGNQAWGAASFLTDPTVASRYADVFQASPALRGLMNAPPALWANRVPIGVGALSANELAALMEEFRQER